MRRARVVASLAALTLLMGSAPAFADPVADTTAPAESTTVTSDTSEPSLPAPPERHVEAAAPDIQVDLAFAKSSYSVADLVTLNLTIHNAGDAVANHVRVVPDVSKVNLTDPVFGDLGQDGVDIAPGDSVTMAATGYINGISEGELTFELLVYSGDDYVTTAEATVTVTPASGDYSGVIYIDKNGNGAFDQGEGLGDVEVTISGGAPTADHDTTTADDGTFSFSDLSGGAYTVWFQAPGGWLVPGPKNHGGDDIVVGGSDQTTGIEYAAIRPLKDTLHLKAAFDKPSYHVGDTATLVLTLSNSGTKRLTGITANCNRAGEISKSWDGTPPPGTLGDKTWDLNPGEHVTIRIPGKVLPGALDLGTLRAGCDFGNSGYLTEGNPSANASAKVLEAGAATGGGSDNGNTPAAQGSTSPDGLAYTGVDVFAPLLGGLVLLSAGAALVLATRRRRLA